MENKHEQLKQIGQKETTVNLIIKEIKRMELIKQE